MDLIDRTLEQIGRTIRARRNHRRMTLGDLARRTDLSLSFLSRVERGHAQTSVGNLIRIAEALGASIQDLVGSGGGSDPDQGFSVFRAAATGSTGVPADGYRWIPVSTGGPGRSLEASLLELAGAPANEPRYAHPGEEFCFVIEGRVRFEVGDRPVVLEPGDAIHLRADIAHSACAATDDRTRMLMITHRSPGPVGPNSPRPDPDLRQTAETDSQSQENDHE